MSWLQSFSVWNTFLYIYIYIYSSAHNVQSSLHVPIPVQSLSCVWLFVTPWTAACQASLSITNARGLLKLISMESVMPSNHLILSSPSPPAFNLSQHQGLFQWVSSLHQGAKLLKLQLQHQSFQWIFRTDFKIDFLDHLAIHRTLKTLLQHHSSKAPIIWYSAFFIPTLTSIHDYWKNQSFD